MVKLLSDILFSSNKLIYNFYMFENLHYSLQVYYNYDIHDKTFPHNYQKYTGTFLICHGVSLPSDAIFYPVTSGFLQNQPTSPAPSHLYQ